MAVDLADGVRYLWHHGPARRALAALTASRAAYGLVLVLTVLLYRNHFTGAMGGLAGLAQVVAASGIGTVLAAVVTPRVTQRMPKARWIAIVLVGGGVVEIALGLPFQSLLFVVAGLLLGFSAQASKICVDTIVQEETEDAYRGRAFSLYDLLFNLAFVAAAAVAALIVPEDGRSSPTIIVAGVGYCLAGLVYYQARDAPPRGPGDPRRRRGPQPGHRQPDHRQPDHRQPTRHRPSDRRPSDRRPERRRLADGDERGQRVTFDEHAAHKLTSP
ncbi:MFS transporter [Parafrankia sp. EUN1f]|uniref:MFS transporter n=1 Tax=Parafrankia sp. EUN1f TaxID=102897 RepID=UPI0001C45F35|nr:hypothetical protein FrEUN1fDRAFT_5188 [Parafrankia sp. EUN1f]